MKVSHEIKRWLLLLCVLLCLCPAGSMAQSRRTPATRTPPPSPPPPPRPLVTQSKSPTIKVDIKGRFIGSTYTNEALGFNVTLPEGWQAQDISVKQQFAESASRRTEELKSQPGTQSSIERTTLLFIAVKPTEGRVNPLVVGMTEDIGLAFNVRTPQQYIENMRRAGEGTPLKFDAETEIEKIGGLTFGVVAAGPRNPETAPVPTVRQRYYVTLLKNHALAFILTYDGAEQLRACREILDSLKSQ